MAFEVTIFKEVLNLTVLVQDGTFITFVQRGPRLRGDGILNQVQDRLSAAVTDSSRDPEPLAIARVQDGTSATNHASLRSHSWAEGSLGVLALVRCVLAAALGVAELRKLELRMGTLVTVLRIVELVADRAVERGDDGGSFGHGKGAEANG